jgi:hypothetical protein
MPGGTATCPPKNGIDRSMTRKTHRRSGPLTITPDNQAAKVARKKE